MADIIIPLDEYKKLLRLANTRTIINNQGNPSIIEERLKSQIEFLKIELELANSINRGLMIKKRYS
jgi:hypothetical protein